MANKSSRLAAETISLLKAKYLGNFIEPEGDKKEEQSTSLILDVQPLGMTVPVPRIYGGNIAANIFLAASKLARPNQYPLTVNVDYLVAGNYDLPQRYEVTRLRSSERFTHVSVVARQNNEIIASGKVSFHVQEERVGLPYTVKFPRTCSLPRDLNHDIEIWNGLLNDSAGNSAAQVMYRYWQVATRIFGMESRVASTKFAKDSTSLCHWIRFKDPEIYDFLSAFGIHWSAALLVWASDFHPMLTIICQQPDYGAKAMSASLAHALWFSSDPEVRLRRPTEEWFLHETVIVMSGNNIGVCEGRLWTDDKKLLALVLHHGLSRPKL